MEIVGLIFFAGFVVGGITGVVMVTVFGKKS